MRMLALQCITVVVVISQFAGGNCLCDDHSGRSKSWLSLFVKNRGERPFAPRKTAGGLATDGSRRSMPNQQLWPVHRCWT